MRKNYFAKLIKYIKSVYNIEEKIKRLKDGRMNLSYKTGQVMLPVLFRFLLRIKSLNELNCMLKENEFKKLFPKWTIDGYTVAVIDGTKIFGSNKKCCKKCLTTLVKGNLHYYHSRVVMSWVGDVPNLVLDYDLNKMIKAR